MGWSKWLVAAGVALLTATPAGAADQTVTATSSNTFSPSDVTIAQGEKVTWTNMGGIHNVRFDDGSFDVPADPSSTWPPLVQRTFTAAGEFTYQCEQHAGMTGIVRVTAATPPSDPGGGGDPGGGSPGGSPPGESPGTPTRPEVTLKVSDRTPRAGRRVRLFGFVRPALDGQPVQIQRRTRSGSFKKVAATKLRDAGDERSKFSLRIRVLRDGVFRARVPARGDREAATSRKKRLDVI
jgi:plastocyanin